MEWEGRTACVFVRAYPGKADVVYDKIKSWEGTIGLFMTTGPYDIIAWIDSRDIDESYKVFNQSYYGDGHKVAQQDSHPLCGRFPTAGWPPGELISDVYRIQVRDVPDGVYPLFTGLYLEENFERLPVLDEAGNPVDNQFHVADIVVESKK